MQTGNERSETEPRGPALRWALQAIVCHGLLVASLFGVGIYAIPQFDLMFKEQGAGPLPPLAQTLIEVSFRLRLHAIPVGVGAGMLMAKINKTYEAPSKVVEGLPAGLDEVFAKAFDPEPDKRYPTAGEFYKALEALL